MIFSRRTQAGTRLHERRPLCLFSLHVEAASLAASVFGIYRLLANFLLDSLTATASHPD
ncbi:hypothetical protein [Burkholderia cepacia]|uniref:hypothetical protein n=1 Tax=Burkholderia cepacia TaxID=292 RepID=UPI000AF4B629|nr:hypothetical protein [Burkholderia cepacia]